MADILFFKNPQVRTEMWAELERSLRAGAVLEGLKPELLSPVIDRMEKFYNRCIERLPQASFTFEPIARLTEKEAQALKRQMEKNLSEQVYPSYVAQIITGVLFEVAAMEGELIRLREKAGE